MTTFEHSQLLSQAIERIDLAPKPIRVIEAFWDGDTSGWFLVIVALMENDGSCYARPDSPYMEQLLLVLQGVSGDLRLFNGLQAPWPESVTATTLGAALAERYQVPFYFPAPDQPDDDCPRWWQQHLAIACRGCGKAIMPPTSPYRQPDLCHPCELKERFRKP